MKTNFVAKAFVATVLSGGISIACYAADAVVSAKDIASQLLTKPKALKQVDGKWVQPDPTIDLQVPFEFNQAKLTDAGKKQLDQLAQAFLQPGLADAKFELAGHTDEVGSQDYNLKLSRDRANAVRDYLIKRHGIASVRMQAQGYGFTRLADAQNPTSAANRRVEVRHLLQGGYGSGMTAPAGVYAPPPAQGYAPAVIVPQAPVQAVAPVPSQPPLTTFPPQTGGRLVPRE